MRFYERLLQQLCIANNLSVSPTMKNILLHEVDPLGLPHVVMDIDLKLYVHSEHDSLHRSVNCHQASLRKELGFPKDLHLVGLLLLLTILLFEL